ncbi:UbiA family prenyltransferase [Cesiribacter andamanensis]|uniref:Bacteriochlorophyll/chlorophyll synthetase n=1 Tax=Cesiribacter andamanensis AMV16 TaxID=1279009 RepID=M7N522_9BACT|nr:UbiA family prenyltransferase [Cesiribacter andamanensis]EMR02397.1 bacteriochlorophyll/chlorophyll synthetase [Cesiribacter andamanensis AMV16]
MLKKSTLLHLRIPFSFYLLPVYLFALSVADHVHSIPAIGVFVALHLLLYPASNGYNSYFDKDEESIGGLKTPPPVSRQLYVTANMLDLAAVLIGWWLAGPLFALMEVVYSLVSRAYSHPAIRLKRYPFISWWVAGSFQGFFTFAMVYVGISGEGLAGFWQPEPVLAACLTTLLLWGSYPMTQIYQHGEDGRRGDRTLSLLLGVRGTFYFTAIAFAIANFAFWIFFLEYYTLWQALVFQLFLLPVLGYFLYWLRQVLHDSTAVGFSQSMLLSTVSALCLNVFFIILSVWTKGL